MLLGSKRAAPKVLLALTDSKSTDDVSQPAKQIRDAGIGVVAVGGNSADPAQLNTIAGKPENAVTTPGFSKFPSVLGSVVGKLNNSKCL